MIYMLDEATHFCSTSVLCSRSARKIWKAIRRIWRFVYLGTPKYLVVDQGSANTSKEMRESAVAICVHVDEVPVEIPGAIEAVGRYHVPL